MFVGGPRSLEVRLGFAEILRGSSSLTSDFESPVGLLTAETTMRRTVVRRWQRDDGWCQRDTVTSVDVLVKR